MNSLPYRIGIRLSDGVDRIAAVLLIAVVLLNIAQILLRYVFFAPLAWSEETMRYATVWMVMLAGSSALFRGEHMEMSIFDRVRSQRVRAAVRWTVLGCIGAGCALLAWYGTQAAIVNLSQRSPAVEIPMVLPYLAVPVGAALMLVKVICLLALPEGGVASIHASQEVPA